MRIAASTTARKRMSGQYGSKSYALGGASRTGKDAAQMPASLSRNRRGDPTTVAPGRFAPGPRRYDSQVEPIDLAACADDFDREVAHTPEIDKFCSTSAWVLAAASSLMPPRAPFSFRGSHGYFAAMRGVHPAGFPYIEP